MSASAMADALVTMLSAASVFGPNMVTKEDYSVLDICSGSCAVINVGGLASEPATFGTPSGRERVWEFRIDTWIKDTGDPFIMRTRVLSLTNLVLTTLESDETLQGTAFDVGRIAMRYDPTSSIYKYGSRLWCNPVWTVAAREYT